MSRRPMLAAATTLLALLTVLLAGPAWLLASGRVDLTMHWSQASRNPTGLAPDPATTPEAVVQVYGARAFNWRGAFAVHTWIAVKPAGAAAYTVYEVTGWRVRRGLPALGIARGAADRQWFGHDPAVYVDHRGAAAEALIPEIRAAAARYPFADRYRAWPGPNSNTFVAHVAREVPGLGLRLPATAVGKDYLGPWRFWAPSTSGTGITVAVAGLFGITLGVDDGIGLTVLGLGLGIDPLAPAIELPGLGRLGAAAE